MKLSCNKKILQKITTVLIVVMLFNFTMPIQSNAEDEFGGKIFKPIFQFFAGAGDIVIGLLNHTMLGTTNMINSVMLNTNDANVIDGIWALDEDSADSVTIKVHYGESSDSTYAGTINDDGFLLFDKDFKIPNMLYCPENIFGNKIAALDVNFINPNSYTGGEGNEMQSTASTLKNVVASWYRAFRNIAVVGLLSILVYIGIRILIGSTAQDKAKYKERLKDWFVGLCLLFVMHYIMAGIMMITENLTDMVSDTLEPNIVVKVDNYKDFTGFKTNLMGYIRFMTQSYNTGDACAYLIMYIALVIYTVIFTFSYLKRVLYMAFFTMIAPLVAMTYPLDKVSDGSAQGFNIWFKEYLMNAIIQPVHLILYIVLVDSAMALAVNNPIYAIIAIGFLVPAEKFIKKMFKLDKGETTSTLGAMAGGALAMKGIQGVTNLSKQIAGKNNSEKVRTANQPNVENENNRGRNSGLADPSDVISLENQRINTNTNTNADANGNTSQNPFEISDQNENILFTGGNNRTFNPWAQNQDNENQPINERNQQETGNEQLENNGESMETYNYGQGRPVDTSNPLYDANYYDNANLENPNENIDFYESPNDSEPFNEWEQNPNNINEPFNEWEQNPNDINEPFNVWEQNSNDINEPFNGWEQNSNNGLEIQMQNDHNANMSEEEPMLNQNDNDNDVMHNQDERDISNNVQLPSRFKRVAGAIGGSISNKVRRLPQNAKNVAISGVKKLPKMAIKAGAMAVGATALGAVAAGAAITTGDAKTAATMIASGATIGGSLGGALGERTGNAMVEKASQVKDDLKNVWYTKEELEQQKVKKREKYDKEWKQREENYKYLRKKGLNSKDAKEFLQDNKTQRFLDANITDINMIYNARKLMDESNGRINIDGAVARAQFAKDASENFKTNYSEQNAFKKNMKSKNSSFKDDELNNLVKDIINIRKTENS